MLEASDAIHLIVSDEGRYGVSARSPQLEGFEYSRQSMTEAERDIHEVLEALGVARRPRVLHEERRYETPEGAEYTVRVRSNDPVDRANRMHTEQRIVAVMGTDQRFDCLTTNAKNPMGELAFICVMPADTIGDVIDQMDHRDAVVLAAAVADQGIWTMTFQSSPDNVEWPSLADQGLTRETTIHQLLQQDSQAELPRQALVRS